MSTFPSIDKEQLKRFRENEIAGLFHDIGKFYQHTMEEGQRKKKHAQYSEDFINQINLPSGFDKERVKTLVRYHHGTEIKEKDLSIIKLADIFSARMDREEEASDDPNRAMISIFSLLHLKKEDNDWYLMPSKTKSRPTKYYKYYAPVPLNIKKETIFPRDEISKQEIIQMSKKTWDQFVEEFKKIPADMPFEQWMYTAEALLKKYTSNVISAGYKTKPTISLYNHLTTTAALARCLSEYETMTPPAERTETSGADEKKFLLIKGDINGIQKFIFKVKNPQQARKNTSKRLRGRSFIVQLLSNAAITKVLDDLDLSINNLLIEGGGNFTIIAPNTARIVRRLRQTIKEINEELLQKYNGEIRLTIQTIEVSPNELRNFAELEDRINQAIQEKKYQPLKEILFNENGDWNLKEAKKYFTRQPDEESELSKLSKCPVCETPKPKEQPFCDECEKHSEIGEALTRATGIIRIKNNSKPSRNCKKAITYDILGYSYCFVDKKNLEDIFSSLDHSIYISFTPENFLLKDIVHNKNGCTFKFIGLSLPKYEPSKVISFNDLAKMGIGYDTIAVFKADIDNLGHIFKNGRTGTEIDRSISQVKELSTRIDLFFSGYLSELANEPQYTIFDKVCETHSKLFVEIQTEEKRTVYRLKTSSPDKINEIKQCSTCKPLTTAIYSIFAGGDDIALAGPWDMVIEFALKFREELKQYVAQNEFITISGGIGLFDEKYPIGRAIEETEELLETSKSLIKVESNNKTVIPVKNSITLFEDTVLWEHDKETYPFHEVRFGDFKQLFQNAKTFEEFINSKKISRSFMHSLLLLWEDRLGILDAESLVKNRTREASYFPIIAYLVARQFNDKKNLTPEYMFDLISKSMPWMRIVSSWALYRTKKG